MGERERDLDPVGDAVDGEGEVVVRVEDELELRGLEDIEPRALHVLDPVDLAEGLHVKKVSATTYCALAVAPRWGWRA